MVEEEDRLAPMVMTRVTEAAMVAAMAEAAMAEVATEAAMEASATASMTGLSLPLLASLVRCSHLRPGHLSLILHFES